MAGRRRERDGDPLLTSGSAVWRTSWPAIVSASIDEAAIASAAGILPTMLATTTAALIIGFHVRPDVKSRGLAERDEVEIRLYSVIYEAVEDVKLALEGMLSPEQREVIVGTAEIRETFKVPKVGTVAGCYVGSGEIHRNLPVRLLREYVQIYDGKIGSLKRFKDDVREVREGYECGIGIEGYNDLKVGDVIECYRVEEVARCSPRFQTLNFIAQTEEVQCFKGRLDMFSGICFENFPLDQGFKPVEGGGFLQAFFQGKHADAVDNVNAAPLFD